MIGRQNVNNNDDDAPPFNFQVRFDHLTMLLFDQLYTISTYNKLDISVHLLFLEDIILSSNKVTIGLKKRVCILNFKSRHIFPLLVLNECSIIIYYKYGIINYLIMWF